MTEATFDKIINLIPWFVLLVVYVGESLRSLVASRALSKALERAQNGPVLGPASPPVAVPTPPPPVVVQPTPVPVPHPVPTAVVDEALAQAVKKFEGFSAKAYPDYKQYSIGYGTKATSPDEVITEEEAVKRLQTELGIAATSVERFAPTAPTGVKQALTSLTYNTGSGWQQQGLGKAIQAQDYEDAKKHFVQYNHAGGAVNDGLTQRRNTEVKWFDNPL